MYETHSDGSTALHQDRQEHCLRRMPGELPVCVQDFLHGRKPEVREERQIILYCIAKKGRCGLSLSVKEKNIDTRISI